MARLQIEGGIPLKGEIRVAGNKNAALPIIAATVLTDEECFIENVPEISDVRSMLAILEDLGKKVENLSPNVYRISGSLRHSKPRGDLTGSLRASILFMSGLLARSGEIDMVPPGGCVIGRRNVESHFEVIRAFGAQLEFHAEGYRATLSNRTPASIFLKESSVTATENAMLLATATPGKSIIENAAGEPHVTDLGDVLSKMGAAIEGSGTNRIFITGNAKLRGFTHRVVSDHIEAGTFAIAAACTRGDLVIHNADREYLKMTEHYLRRMNVSLEFSDEHTLRVVPSELISKTKKIQVGLWPGFPTDLMSPMIVLATQAEGTTLCHDWMYESRMFFVDKLIIMGADITQCDPHRVLVVGPTRLRGQELSSPDIRAGIALVIAALTAEGTSVIDRIEIVDRGYEMIEKRFELLGAKVRRFD